MLAALQCRQGQMPEFVDEGPEMFPLALLPLIICTATLNMKTALHTI